MAAYSSLSIDTGSQSGPELTGWAEINCTGPLAGYAAFDHVTSRGVTAGLESAFSSSFLLPYSHAGGCQAGLALVNLDDTNPARVIVTIWNENWDQLAVKNLDLAASGHTAFLLADKFPVTAAAQGMIEFRSALGGNITGLGLRFDPDGRFVLMPKLAQPAPASK